MIRLKVFFHAPQFASDDIRNQQAKVLHALWLNSWLVALMMTVGTLVIFSDKLTAALSVIFQLGMLLAVGFLQYQRRIDLASDVLVIGYWMLITLSICLSGGQYFVLSTWYISLAVMAVLLLGRQKALVLTGITTLVYLGIAILSQEGQFLPIFFTLTPLASWFLFVFALLTSIVPLNLALQALRFGLTAARQEKNRYTFLFEQAPVMYLTLFLRDGALIISNCNTIFLNTLHYERAQVIGQPLSAFFEPIAVLTSLAESILVDRVETQTSSRVEGSLVASGGTAIPALVQITPEWDERGRISGILAMFTDISDRKAAEESLRESSDLNRLVAEITSDYIFVVDVLPSGLLKMRWASDSMQRLTGRTVDEAATSETWKNIIHPDDLPGFSQFIQTLMITAKPGGIQCRSFTKSGEMRWIEIGAQPVTNEQGQVVTFVGAIKDITEKRQVEEALRASERSYREIYNAATEAIFIHELPSGKVVGVNESMLRMFGYDTEAEALAAGLENLHAAIPPYTMEEAQKKIDEAAAVGLVSFEWLARRKSGELFWAETILRRTQIGGQDRVLAVVRDISQRKQAEEALHAATSRLKAVIEVAPLAITMVDDQDVIQVWNPAAERIFGWKAEEVIGRPNPIVPAGKGAEYAAWVSQVIGGKEFTNLETVRQRKDGSLVEVSISTSPIYDSQGQVAGRMAIFTDIAERKKAEGLLQETTTRLNALFTASPVGIVAFDTNGIITIWNQAATQIFGRDAAESIGKPLLSQDYRRLPELRALNERFLSGEVISGAEITFTRSDGSLVEISVNSAPLRDNDGKITGFMALLEDITPRKQAERALRESEARYRQAIEAAGAVPYYQSYGEDGKHPRFDFMGEGIRQITGYGPEEMTAKLWDSLVLEAYPIEQQAGIPFTDAVRQIRAGGNPIWKCDFKLQARDGSIHWVFDAAVELRDESGVSHGSIGMLQDITERKRIEEELHHLNAELESRVSDRTAQLEAAVNELESFSYSVSHDLRAPLRAIDGYSLMLQEEHANALSPEALHLLKRVRKNTSKMSQLIDDLLKFSRLSRQPLNRQVVQPAELVHKALDALGVEREGRSLNLIVGNLAACYGDPALLTQVWVNLLSNALKYTRKCTLAQIEVGSQRTENGQTVYFVRDNGVGFDMAYYDKLFGVFQRLHSDSEFEGTGVGLALTKHIIHRHGGRIWAEAGVDQGATFYFTLPSPASNWAGSQPQFTISSE